MEVCKGAGAGFLAGTLKNTFKPHLWVEREVNNIGVSSTGERREGCGPQGQVMYGSRLG